MTLTGRDTRFPKIRALRCFQEVYDRLCAGWSMPELARFIQEERQEYLDVTRSGLAQQLADFRKTVPAGHLVQKRFPEVFDKAKARVEAGLNELEELEELYRVQKARIDIDYNTEKSIKKLMPSMTGEIREARQLLESMATLKMDMGIITRAQKTGPGVNVSVEVEAKLHEEVSAQFGSPEVKAVLESPESRRRVMGVVERFMKLPAAKPEGNTN
jgi:hypothetical protein